MPAVPRSPTDPFAPFVSGRDYGLLSLQSQFTTELGVSLVGLANLVDGTAVVIPTATLRPTGALEVAASAQVPARFGGAGGEFSPRRRDLVTRIPPAIEGAAPETLDFSGLVPSATVFLWTRVNF